MCRVLKCLKKSKIRIFDIFVSPLHHLKSSDAQRCSSRTSENCWLVYTFLTNSPNWDCDIPSRKKCCNSIKKAFEIGEKLHDILLQRNINIEQIGASTLLRAQQTAICTFNKYLLNLLIIRNSFKLLLSFISISSINNFYIYNTYLGMGPQKALEEMGPKSVL